MRCSPAGRSPPLRYLLTAARRLHLIRHGYAAPPSPQGEGYDTAARPDTGGASPSPTSATPIYTVGRGLAPAAVQTEKKQNPRFTKKPATRKPSPQGEGKTAGASPRPTDKILILPYAKFFARFFSKKRIRFSVPRSRLPPAGGNARTGSVKFISAAPTTSSFSRIASSKKAKSFFCAPRMGQNGRRKSIIQILQYI